MTDSPLSVHDDWVYRDELTARLTPDTLRRLRPHLHHRDFDGSPCVEAERLEELLQLLRVEGDAP
jgi:hypothetical protein